MRYSDIPKFPTTHLSVPPKPTFLEVAHQPKVRFVFQGSFQCSPQYSGHTLRSVARPCTYITSVSDLQSTGFPPIQPLRSPQWRATLTRPTQLEVASGTYRRVSGLHPERDTVRTIQQYVLYVLWRLGSKIRVFAEYVPTKTSCIPKPVLRTSLIGTLNKDIKRLKVVFMQFL